MNNFILKLSYVDHFCDAAKLCFFLEKLTETRSAKLYK